MSSVEMEIKSEWPIRVSSSLMPTCASCGETAERTVEFGEVGSSYTSGDEVNLCEDMVCLEKALEQAAQNILDIKKNRKELSGTERWELREGK